MKAVLEFFDASWLQILGYTLLHSVWEAFIVSAIVILVLRFIPNKLSTVRYIIASLGLMAIVSLSIGTFVYLQCHIDRSNFYDEQYHSSRHDPTSARSNVTPVSTYLDEVKCFHSIQPSLVSDGMDFWNIPFFTAYTDRVSLCGESSAGLNVTAK